MPTVRPRLLVLTLLGGLLGPTPLLAQHGASDGRAQAGDVTAVLVGTHPTSMDEGGRLSPGLTINTPTAFGPGWGQVYAGVSYQDRLRYTDWHDGLLAAGIGLGNPARTVGLVVAGSLLDTYTDFGEDRSLSLKLHRRLPYRSALAVGVENVWHTRGTDGGTSRYVVASTVRPLRADPTAPLGSVAVSVGLGDERFLAEARFAEGDAGVNVFGGLAVRLLRPVNGLVNWSGQDLNLGLSVTPHRALPVALTGAVLDVTGRAGDGARGAVGATLGVDLRRGRP